MLGADSSYGTCLPPFLFTATEETSKVDQAIPNPGLWRCPICTFDNDQGISACDICGVLRDPVVNNNGNKETANPVELASSRASSSIIGKKEKVNVLPSMNTLETSSALVPEAGQPSADDRNCSSVNEDKLQSLTSGFNKVKMGADSGCTQNRTNTTKASLRSQYKPETWMLPDQEGILTQLNLAIVGHVDSGKSTLSGRLLNLLGRISQKDMHKYEKEAKLKGKGSFSYAWALDESAEERERGITMTVAVAYFDSKKYHVVLLDSPGHKDFVPNMISGATQADAAILVIDASMGSFEAGIDANGGQTREHAQLIRSFGVDQVIVAINKMDAVGYSMERFDSIKSQLGMFLRSCGFKDSFLLWIPMSAMENQNLVAAASDVRLSSWYQGPYLLDALDSLQPPIRDISKPLRMPICDVIKSHSLGQVAASGKLESGALRSGLKVLVLPSGDLATVRSIERDSRACTIARAGDNVAVSLQGIDGNCVMSGGVLCHPDFPVAVATHLELKVLTLDVVMPILIGSQVEFHVHHAKEAARVGKIVSLIDQKTGKASKRAIRCLTTKQSALIEVILDGAVCVEEFSDCRALGRVFLRASGRTVAVGIITRIIDPPPFMFMANKVPADVCTDCIIIIMAGLGPNALNFSLHRHSRNSMKHLEDLVMKSLPEKIVSSKVPARSSIDSPHRDPASVSSEQKTSDTKSSKASLWSSFFPSSFSVFETYTEASPCEKKASNSKTYGWATAVKRIVAGGSMRRLQERLLGPSKTGVSCSTSEIWLLGVCYKISPEDMSDDPVHCNGLVEFVNDFSSRIWITYRKGFDAIGDSKFTSDVNWGCMLRSGQMLVAQALLFHHLGRSWRKPFEKPFDQEYIQILSLFGDSEASSFSIHNLIQAGKAYGLAAGSWVGPYAMCRSLETLARFNSEHTDPENHLKSLPMAVYIVSGDEDGERGGAPVLCIEDAARLCSEFGNGRVDWTPILLLVPLVLGLDKVNTRYIPSLWTTFTFPQSLGILGGKPGASTYIVGVQDDKAFYLDPHEVQPVTDIRGENLEADTTSYHCSVVRNLPLDMIDPSLAIGFYCRDKDDFDDFCARASKLAEQSNGAPLFTITKSRNLPTPVQRKDVVTEKLHGDDVNLEMEIMSDSEDHPREDEWQLL
ncbi:Elongation factor [Macleaya cordata]|uniref:Elongation factor n=1 Tax=Macleaya cordata TaxID=56857 RepID=A0A200R8C0_MACCD|nr:Elongation factor [Macleaya cordata]